MRDCVFCRPLADDPASGYVAGVDTGQ